MFNFMTDKQKRLADKEVELYVRERKAENAESINEAFAAARNDLHQLRKKNVVEAFEDECEFHRESEERNVKLAKLDAQIEAKESYVARLDSVPELESRATRAEALVGAKEDVILDLRVQAKDREDLIKFLAGMLPKVELDKLSLNLNADIKTTVKSDA